MNYTNYVSASGTTYSNRFMPDDQSATFYAPGAPRAGWIGVRYEFGGPAKQKD